MGLFEKEVKTDPKHTNEELYYRQIELLKTFLEHRAISKKQYEKSSHDLKKKTGFIEKTVITTVEQEQRQSILNAKLCLCSYLFYIFTISR